MMPWVYLIIVVDLACIASGTCEHYGWAWIPFLVLCTTDVAHTKKESDP